MNVLVKGELEQFVEEQVKSGRFASSEEVVRAGLLSLKHQPVDDFQFEPGEMKALVAVGDAEIERGDGLSIDEVRERLRRKGMIR